MMRTMYLVQHVRRKVWCQRIPALLHHPSGWMTTFAAPDPLPFFFPSTSYHLSLFSLPFFFPPQPCFALRTHSPHIIWWLPCAYVRVNVWSWKQVRGGGGDPGRLCFCIEVSMSQQDWILPWSLTLSQSPQFPSALCLDKGPPALLSRGPQALTAEMQAGVIIQTGRRADGARAQSSPPNPPPTPLVLCSQTHQLSSVNPQSSHCNLGALLLLFRCNKQVIVYLLQALLQHKALTKVFVNFKCWESDPSGLIATQFYEVLNSHLFHVIYRTYIILNHLSEKVSASTCGSQ